jgi:hypothetical protein
MTVPDHFQPYYSTEKRTTATEKLVVRYKDGRTKQNPTIPVDIWWCEGWWVGGHDTDPLLRPPNFVIVAGPMHTKKVCVCVCAFS